jgi:hypothetical protein
MVTVYDEIDFKGVSSDTATLSEINEGIKIAQDKITEIE